MTHLARFMRTTAISAAVSIALLQPAMARAADLPSADPISKLKWRDVGPYIGGRVVAVDGVASQPNVFYMGAVDGGVWKSTNYGLSWKNLSDKWPSASDSIGAIAVAPSNPNVIYAGTGESDIRGDMITGDGVYRSTDAGKTWSYAGLRDTHTTMDLLVDPRDSNTVYAASMGHVFIAGPDRGVFKSTDGGKSWRKVLFVDDKTGAVDLSMDPKNPAVLYAATWQAYRNPWHLESGGPGSGIYKSTDGGEHWTNISRNAGLPAGVLGKIGVAVAPSNANILYATIQAKDGGIFRSDDAGASWRRVNANMQLRERAFYYMAIFVDPKDPDTIYVPQVGGLYVSHDAGKTFTTLHVPHGDNHIVWVNPRNTNILLEGNDGGATVSVDRGKTWSTVHNQPTGQFYHVNLDERFPFHIYGAQQDEGSIEGPSASSQGQIDLGAWQPAASGESTWVVPEPGNPKVTYGSGYYSIFLRYDPDTEEYRDVTAWPRYREGAAAEEQEYRLAWTHPILFSPTNPKEMLVGSQYVMTSDDYGATWRTISPDLTRNDKSTQGPSGGPVDLDQTGVETYPYIEALAVSPLDGNIIWAGSADGLVHVTTNHGQSWQHVSPNLPGWAEISSIEPSNVDRGTAYLTASRYMWDDFTPYVFKTTDYGRTWTPITSGLPGDQYALSLKEDPGDPELLFLATKNTVFASFDGGSSWRPLTLNLPHAQVRDIAINQRQGSVVAATHGRAFWVLDNLALLEQLTRNPPSDAAGTALFAPERAWLTHAYGAADEESQTDVGGENPPFGATVFFRVPKSYDGHTPVKLSFADSNGTIIRSFDLHLKTKADAEEKDESDEQGASPGKSVELKSKAEAPEKEAVDEDNPLALPADLKAKGQHKATAIERGMNSFRWNLRYPDATEVKGFYTPAAAGGYDNDVTGPVVTPGTYRVILDYGGHKTEKQFDVAVDPRVKATPADLDARLALMMQIHQTLDRLNRTVNQAIDARDRLAGKPGAANTIAALNAAIAPLVQFGIQSDEGNVLYPIRLRSQLADLAADVDLAYARPTVGQYAVFKQLDAEANQGEQRIMSILASMK
jgi:photosystem II stability/assembly factor-like uncharacterized protein